MITIIRVDYKEPSYHTGLEPGALDNIANSNHTHSHANTRTYSQTDTHTVNLSDRQTVEKTNSKSDRQTVRQTVVNSQYALRFKHVEAIFIQFLFSVYISRFHFSVSEQTNTVRRVSVVRHDNRYVTVLLSDMITAM